MIVISNAGPLIALGRIYRADLFQKLFGHVIIPDTVRREVVANCPDAMQKRYLEDAVRDFIDVRHPLTHHIFTRNLGEGERDVLSLAIEMSPDIILPDDKKARNEAKALGYMPSFTTDIIKEAECRGRLNARVFMSGPNRINLERKLNGIAGRIGKAGCGCGAKNWQGVQIEWTRYMNRNKRMNPMENLHMIEGKFIDRKTIQLLEEYPFHTKEVRLIILPEKKPKGKRKAGLLKGKIRMTDDFNEPLEDMKEYME